MLPVELQQCLLPPCLLVLALPHQDAPCSPSQAFLHHHISKYSWEDLDLEEGPEGPDPDRLTMIFGFLEHELSRCPINRLDCPGPRPVQTSGSSSASSEKRKKKDDAPEANDTMELSFGSALFLLWNHPRNKVELGRNK